jgi:putative flippase GtrA
MKQRWVAVGFTRLMHITRLDAEVCRQAIRFGMAGTLVTGLSASIFMIGVIAFGMPPLIATLQAYLIAAFVGYRLHAYWTFEQCHEALGELASLRFFIASLSSLALNSLWTWMLTIIFKGPEWLPVVPMATATPLAAFLINRRWVFPKAAT